MFTPLHDPLATTKLISYFLQLTKINSSDLNDIHTVAFVFLEFKVSQNSS